MQRRVMLTLSGLALALLGALGCTRGVVDRERPAEEILRDGKVVLGSPRLTAGIPGDGPLTLGEIDAWLADERNHEPLDVCLPLSLADASEELRIPSDNPLTRAKIELGRQLFFDQRLSRFGDFSCATCHQPRQSYSAYQVMPEVGRNASAVLNRILGSEHFWDGRADSLEAQPHSPVKNPFEMNSSPETTTALVEAVAGYRRQFEVIFGEVNFENICRALASFERVLVTGLSPWDCHRLVRQLEEAPGDLGPSQAEALAQIRLLAAERPMSEAALRGEELFFGDRAACGYCHTGPNLTDEQYHNLGVGMDAANPDLGRMKVTGEASDRGAFKTPSLRNVPQTPPYMHNGRFGRLEEVIDFLDRGGHPNENLSPMIRPLYLSDDEKADLIAFLHTLTSELPPVETGRLPE